jgi:general stress protein YciG
MSFAKMTPERHREICSMGGKAAQKTGRTHRFSGEEARINGAKGAAKVMSLYGVGHMQAIGQKGGRATSQDREHMSRIGKIGGQRIPSRDA